jgi:hypothetical protein
MDAPMLPDLLEQIPPDQEIAAVTADWAYDTRRCHNVIAARGAAAIIPPLKNAQLWKPTTAGAPSRQNCFAIRLPRRGEDELRLTPRPRPHGPRLRPTGR